jgi:hypothetical protein
MGDGCAGTPHRDSEASSIAQQPLESERAVPRVFVAPEPNQQVEQRELYRPDNQGLRLPTHRVNNPESHLVWFVASVETAAQIANAFERDDKQALISLMGDPNKFFFEDNGIGVTMIDDETDAAASYVRVEEGRHAGKKVWTLKSFLSVVDLKAEVL